MDSTSYDRIHNGPEKRRPLDHLAINFEPIDVSVLPFVDDEFVPTDLHATTTEVDFNNEIGYTISPVDESDKLTRGLANCTSVIAVGVDKESEKHISFLSHQSDPIMDDTDLFRMDLIDRLQELLNKSMENSVDVVLGGGNFTHPLRQKHYAHTIAEISSVVRTILGFEPYVATGPKLDVAIDEMILFETQERELHIFRSQNVGEIASSGYMPGDLDELAPEWVKEHDEYQASKRI